MERGQGIRGRQLSQHQHPASCILWGGAGELGKRQGLEGREGVLREGGRGIEERGNKAVRKGRFGALNLDIAFLS